MDSFNYKNDTKIIFGKDSFSEIGKNIKIFSKKTPKILLHYEANGELIKNLVFMKKLSLH